MTDLKNDLEQTLISEGTKAMMLKLAEESYRQGVNDTLETAKETVEKAVMLTIEKALAAERQRCAKVCYARDMGGGSREDQEAKRCGDAILFTGKRK